MGIRRWSPVHPPNRRAVHLQEFIEGEPCAAVSSPRRKEPQPRRDPAAVGIDWLHGPEFHYCGSVTFEPPPSLRTQVERMGEVIGRLRARAVRHRLHRARGFPVFGGSESALHGLRGSGRAGHRRRGAGDAPLCFRPHGASEDACSTQHKRLACAFWIHPWQGDSVRARSHDISRPGFDVGAASRGCPGGMRSHPGQPADLHDFCLGIEFGRLP